MRPKQDETNTHLIVLGDVADALTTGPDFAVVLQAREVLRA